MNTITATVETKAPLRATSRGRRILRRIGLGILGFIGVLVACAVVGMVYALRLRGSHTDQRAFRQLNFRREAIFQAAFAPDGKTVVYSAATEGNTPEIFTVHPEFPAPQSLGTRGMHLLAVSSKGELAILVGATRKTDGSPLRSEDETA